MTVHKRAGRRLDLVALRRAIELRDLDTMLGFYAEDAQVRVLNGAIPQSPPFELRGKAEIAGYLRALCEEDTTRRVGNGVANEKRIAFSETCEYPNETGIVVHTTLELSEGKIVGQVDVVVREAREEVGEGSV
jgi:SnoaL-like domain